MRKLGEQWVEDIDGKMHMMKAVGPFDLCQGCLFNCNQGGCCWKGFDDCQMGNYFIIKDLGVLNEDGCLPSDFGMYPEVYEHVLMGINGHMAKAYSQDPHVGKYAWGETKQEAIDAWNRRT